MRESAIAPRRFERPRIDIRDSRISSNGETNYSVVRCCCLQGNRSPAARYMGIS
jgi:hypothetical protein